MARHRRRGRPTGSFGFRGYSTRLSKVNPELGKVYSTYGSSHVRKIIAQEVRKEVHAGRPKSGTQSMQVVSGHLRVRLAKSREIRVGNRVVSA